MPSWYVPESPPPISGFSLKCCRNSSHVENTPRPNRMFLPSNSTGKCFTESLHLQVYKKKLSLRPVLPCGVLQWQLVDSTANLQCWLELNANYNQYSRQAFCHGNGVWTISNYIEQLPSTYVHTYIPCYHISLSPCHGYSAEWCLRLEKVQQWTLMRWPYLLNSWKR